MYQNKNQSNQKESKSKSKRNQNKSSKFTDSAGNESKIRVEQLFSGATLDIHKKKLKIRRYFLSMNDWWKIKMTYPAILHTESGDGKNQIYKYSEDDLNKALKLTLPL